mgnify:FL=1
MTGYITKGIGGFYYVKTSEGIVECKPRGIFRKQKICLLYTSPSPRDTR